MRGLGLILLLVGCGEITTPNFVDSGTPDGAPLDARADGGPADAMVDARTPDARVAAPLDATPDMAAPMDAAPAPDAEALPVSTPVRVDDSPANATHGQLTWSDEAAEFAIVWQDSRVVRPEVWFTTRAANGAVSVPPRWISDRGVLDHDQGEKTLPAIAAGAEGYRVVMRWASAWFSRAVGVDGAFAPDEMQRALRDGGEGVELRWDAGAWTIASALAVGRLGRDGASIAEWPIEDPEVLPTMASLTSVGDRPMVGYMAQMAEGASQIRVARFTAQLRPEGAVQTLFAPEGVAATQPAFVYANEVITALWTLEGGGVVMSRVLAADGAPVAGPLALGGTNSSQPHLVRGPEEYAAVWIDQPDANPPGVYFSRVDTLSFRRSAPIRLSGSLAAAEDPRIVWTGEQYGVVWTERGADELRSIWFAHGRLGLPFTLE